MTLGQRLRAALSRAELGRARAQLDEATRLLVDADDAEARASLSRVRSGKLSLVRGLKRSLDAVTNAPVPAVAAALSLEFLQACAGEFAGVWLATGGEERRALVNAVVARLPVEVVPRPHPQAYERRVGPVVFRPWLAPFYGE